MDLLQATPTSTSQGQMNLNESASEDASQNGKPAGNQRNRPQLSCISCRQSKLKCDRKNPCSQCTKKGKASQCAFQAPMARRKQAVSMQSRLKHLESLVKNAMTVQSPIAQHIGAHDGNDTPESNPQVSLNPNSDPKAFQASDLRTGQILNGSNEATYVGGSNWAAIFEDIEEIQSYFEADEDPVDNIKPFTTLNFNTQSSATKFQVLANLPNRSEVDRLVSSYFNSNSPALQIIHKPTFQKQYQKFWSNLEVTPVAWLGLLFSILVIASISHLSSVNESSEQYRDAIDLLRIYRESCIQCLLLSNYTNPGPHTIETLSIYMEGDFLLSKNDQVHLFLLVGNTVRLAMRMGIHRDSSKVGGNITPFQGEMRRRIWHHLVQIDILSSSHIGLPGATQNVESDTRYPSNLRDEDFSEDSVELPPPRSDSELTPMTYTIRKSHISHVAGKITTLANLLKLPPYGEVMKLDGQLQVAHSEVPTFFQLTPQTFITDSPERVIKRFSIALLYQKSRCLLHRAFMVRGKQHPEYAYSRTVGLEASIELLKYQTMVLEAALPGGPISRDRWFLSSLSMHDFLMAAMVVYMSIMQLFETGVTVDGQEMREMVNHLSKSHNTWTKYWPNASEAKKATSILAEMLDKVRIAAEKSTGSVSVSSCIDGRNGPRRFQPNSTLGLTLGDPPPPHGTFRNLLSFQADWTSSESTTPSSGNAALSNTDFEAAILPLEGLGDFSGDFDWELFDNELRSPQVSSQGWPDFTGDFLPNTDLYH